MDVDGGGGECHHYPPGKYRLPSNMMALITSGCGELGGGFNPWLPDDRYVPGQVLNAPRLPLQHCRSLSFHCHSLTCHCLPAASAALPRHCLVFASAFPLPSFHCLSLTFPPPFP